MIRIKGDLAILAAIFIHHGFTNCQSIDAIIEAEAKSTFHEFFAVIIVSLVSWQGGAPEILYLRQLVPNYRTQAAMPEFC